jgi:hypothetical protein
VIGPLQTLTHCSQERDIDVSGWIFFVLSFYPLYTFISSVFMSLIPLQHTTKTPVPPAGFELNIPAGERPQTYALDRAVTGIGGSNPQPHQASDRKPSPYTARQLGSAMLNLQNAKSVCEIVGFRCDLPKFFWGGAVVKALRY